MNRQQQQKILNSVTVSKCFSNLDVRLLKVGIVGVGEEQALAAWLEGGRQLGTHGWVWYLQLQPSAKAQGHKALEPKIIVHHHGHHLIGKEEEASHHSLHGGQRMEEVVDQVMD